jgi:membrane protein
MHWTDWFGLVKRSAVGWYRGQSFQQGAALAFYGAFALAPTLVIAISVAGVIFGEDAVQGQLGAALEVALGRVVANAFSESLAHVHTTHSGWASTTVGVAVTVIAATGLFLQLQSALNAIWGVPQPDGVSLWRLLRNRFLSFIVIVGLGALLMMLIIANAALAIARNFLPDQPWVRDSDFWRAVNWALLLVLMTLLFALIYRLLPSVRIDWRDVWAGAAVSAFLFAVGNYLIGYVLGNLAPSFAYWAASSLVVVMLWVYYSSQTVLFGAEFTKNLSEARRHLRLQPQDAVDSPRRARAGATEIRVPPEKGSIAR